MVEILGIFNNFSLTGAFPNCVNGPSANNTAPGWIENVLRQREDFGKENDYLKRELTQVREQNEIAETRLLELEEGVRIGEGGWWG